MLRPNMARFGPSELYRHRCKAGNNASDSQGYKRLHGSDNDRKAIAIEAADPQFRNQLMGSTHVVNWLESPETFNVEFVYVSEKDGEPKYEFWVNERLIKSSHHYH